MTHENAYIHHCFALLTAAALVTGACTAGKTTPLHSAAVPANDMRAQPRAADVQEEEVSVEERGRAVIHTTEGPITVTFFPGVAPRTVEHITDLMKAGCYEGVDFFRLEPGFVIQVTPVADRACHPDAMSTVPAEFSQVRHERLSLSLARWDDIDSGTSSWSIMLGAAPSMDGQYTVFGRVVAGEETIEKIEAIGSTPGKDGMRRLDRRVAIERVDIIDTSKEPDQEAEKEVDQRGG